MQQAKVTDYFRCKRKNIQNNKLLLKALDGAVKKENLESDLTPVLKLSIKGKREELESQNDAVVSTPCKKFKFETSKPLGKQDDIPQVLPELTCGHLAEETVEKSIRKLQSTPRSRDVIILPKVTSRSTTSRIARKQKAKDKVLQKTPSTPSSNGIHTKPSSHSARKRLLSLLVQDDCPQPIHPCMTPKYENSEERETLSDAKDQLAVARISLKSLNSQTSQTEDNTIFEPSVEETKDDSIDLSREERIKAIQDKYSKQGILKANIQDETSEFKDSPAQMQVPKDPLQSSKGQSIDSPKEEKTKKIQESLSKLIDLKVKLKETQNRRAELKEKIDNQVPGYQKYHYLTIPPSKSLSLPYKYKSLEESFQHSDRILSFLHNRHELCTFSKLQQAVQRVTKRTFGKTQLGQIKTVFPQAYHFSLEKSLSALSSDSSGNYQLIITPNFEEDTKPDNVNLKEIDVYKEVTGSVSKKSFTVMDSMCLTKRHSVFHHNILEITKQHHEKFLANLNPPVHIPSDKILRWHPRFPLDSVPDIPVSLLPEALDSKYLRANDVLCLIKNRTYDKVVKALQSVAEKHTESDKLHIKPSLEKVVQKGALKGIPQALLDKVCAREALRMQRVMTRQPDVEKRLEMISRFPELVSILRNYFITLQKAAIGIDDVSKKVSDSYRSHLTSESAEQHLYLMADLLPEWISIITISKGPFVKIDKNKDIKIVIEKINCLIKQES